MKYGKTIFVAGALGALLALCGCAGTPTPPPEPPPLPPPPPTDDGKCACGPTCPCANEPESVPEPPPPPPPPPNFWGCYGGGENEVRYELTLDEAEHYARFTRRDASSASEKVLESGLAFLVPDESGSTCLVDLRVPEFRKYRKRLLKISRIDNETFELLIDVGGKDERSLGKNFTKEEEKR